MFNVYILRWDFECMEFLFYFISFFTSSKYVYMAERLELSSGVDVMNIAWFKIHTHE